jgi:Ca2+/Na+ antiporter
MLDHLDKRQTGVCLGLIMFLLLFGGAHITSHILFGILMFVGLVALVENVESIKKIVYMSNKLLDVGIFIASILATIYMGVTITGAVTVASIIFSLVYAPMIRNERKAQEEIKDEIKKQKINSFRYKLIRNKRKLK